MGMSASAHLAWGVNLAQYEYDEVQGVVDEKIEELLEDDWELTKLFGFTEGFPYGADQDVINEYVARREAATPVGFEFTGTYDYGGKLLVAKRTAHEVTWGATSVPSIPANPNSSEVEALSKVLDTIGFSGDRTPRLLLWALYG